MCFYLDASPYGLGGVMTQDGVILAWFACPLTVGDERIPGCRRGISEGQHIWESLCLLVALKLWLSAWGDKKVNISIKSDNMAALSLAAKMKSKVSSLIAKEVALIISKAAFRPRLVVHVPGVMNLSADSLSRLEDPDGDYSIPAYLLPSLRTSTSPRTETFYRTLRPNEPLDGAG